MPGTRVLVGPFKRRIYAEGLVRLLRDEPDFAVSLMENEDQAVGLMDSATPLVVILEASDEAGKPAPKPRSDAVAVILISPDTSDLQIAMRDLDRSRLRAAIQLAVESPPPRVVSFELDPAAQAPFSLPGFRHSETSGLSQVIAWLDAVLARALSELAAARGGTSEPWIGELDHLRRGFAVEGEVAAQSEEALFQALMAAPGWCRRLVGAFALDPHEVKLLCLAAAPDLDHRYAQAIGLLQNDYSAPRPNATTLARLVGEKYIGADLDALMSGRRAFARLRMIRPAGGEAPQPEYRVSPTLLAMMIGLRTCRGAGWALQTDAPPAQAGLTEGVARVLGAPQPPTVLAMGEGPAVADEVAAAVRAAGRNVLRVDCAAMKDTDAALAVADRTLAARLHDAVLIFENIDELEAASRAALLNADVQGLVPGIIMVGRQATGIGDKVVTLPVPKAGIRDVARRWRAAAADHGLELTEETARRLGGTLRLPIADIGAVARCAAGWRRVGSDKSDEALVLAAARNVAARHAPDTVRRAPGIFGWDDIVLPEPIKRQVCSIPDHVRHSGRVLDDWDFASRLPYGRGIGVLLSGPSGTGKTMCAQVIARALGVEMLQVEVSRCVSKYIGETEKNIDRCFAAAEAASAVLLFDEADAIFGKRTEIKDAHDRHANVEVAYLLQRIEAYEGLVILTTNLKSNIDAAFLRRLRFVIEFPMPDVSDRERIWQLAIPSAACCAPDVDTAFLARRLPLSGGSIQSIAVNAAFGAAAEDCDEIHIRHIMEATRAELIKNGMFSTEKAIAAQAAMEAGRVQ